MAIERVHPMAVHFPIALLIVSVFLDFLRVAAKKEIFEKSGFHLLVLGVVSAAIAVIFGLLAEDAAPKISVVHDIIETHEILAFVTTGIFAALLIIRYIFIRKNNFDKIRIVYLIVSVVGIGILLTTAFLGGELVYEHGAAVSKAILK